MRDRRPSVHCAYGACHRCVDGAATVCACPHHHGGCAEHPSVSRPEVDTA